jgi:hypothetical protein
MNVAFHSRNDRVKAARQNLFGNAKGEAFDRVERRMRRQR